MQLFALYFRLQRFYRALFTFYITPIYKKTYDCETMSDPTVEIPKTDCEMMTSFL